MSKDRFLIVGYTTKGSGLEFSSLKGYVLLNGNPIPPFGKIRADCLDWANRDGDNFSYFQVNFMKFTTEDDYRSFMEIQ